MIDHNNIVKFDTIVLTETTLVIELKAQTVSVQRIYDLTHDSVFPHTTIMPSARLKLYETVMEAASLANICSVDDTTFFRTFPVLCILH